MADERQSFVLGDLVAVEKEFRDRETGVVRRYFGYEVHFANGATVRFAPLQDDRALLRFLIQTEV